jgi:nitrile hydratase subunit beta
MNGAHDMGGTQGFGSIEREVDEPAFHAEWERRAFALTLAMGATGLWSIDASRFAREDRPPLDYLSRTYYEIWEAGLVRLCAERGLVTAEEIEAGRSLRPARPIGRTLAAADVEPMLMRGGAVSRELDRPARFAVGDRVRARNTHPRTHTRLPRYVRGRTGTVERVHGCHVFPDVHAHGGGEDPQWLYTVRFEARELWGQDADPAAAVSVDAFEPYLESA